MLYPPNPLASAILTTLGHTPRVWLGVIAIVGTETDDGITTSLTGQQRTIIGKAHRLAAGRQPSSPPVSPA